MQSFVVLHIKPFCSQQHRIQTLHNNHIRLIRAKKVLIIFLYNIFTLNGVNNLYRIILDVKAIWENLLYIYKIVWKKPIPKNQTLLSHLSIYPFSNSNHSPIHEHLISLPFIFFLYWDLANILLGILTRKFVTFTNRNT